MSLRCNHTQEQLIRINKLMLQKMLQQDKTNKRLEREILMLKDKFNSLVNDEEDVDEELFAYELDFLAENKVVETDTEPETETEPVEEPVKRRRGRPISLNPSIDAIKKRKYLRNKKLGIHNPRGRPVGSKNDVGVKDRVVYRMVHESGKEYIGHTSDPNVRKGNHFKRLREGKGPYFYRKSFELGYKPHEYTFDILIRGDYTEQEIHDLELQTIEERKPFFNYNNNN